MPKPRWRWLALALGLWLQPAHAETLAALAPSVEGHLGAWLVSGPLAASQAKAQWRRGGLTYGVALNSGAPRLLCSPDGAIDLMSAFAIGPEAGPYAVASADFDLAEQREVWLLLAVDGGVAVSVDGQVVFERNLRKLRDRSWDPLRLTLDKGRHQLSLLLHHTGEHWAFAARVLDTHDLLPPKDLRELLPGVTPAQSELLVDQLAAVRLSAALTPSGYRPRLTLEMRRGFPVTTRLPLEVELGGALSRTLRLGEISTNARGSSTLVAELPEITFATPAEPSVRELTAELRIGGVKKRTAMFLYPGGPALKQRADAALHALSASAAPVLRSGLEWHVKQLERALYASPANASSVVNAAARLDEALHFFEQPSLAHTQAFLHAPGIRDLALTSVDGEPQQVRVHVPASYVKSSERRYPLTLLLHGYKGTPESVLEAFLDSRALSPHPKVDGFLLAPAAHGDAFYRGPGETAVMAALDWALQTYPIDPARVSITGVSMGGTGTAELALRYPERFAAAAPLAGYQSFFIRRDIAGLPQRQWERQVMHHWSPASWAEMGQDLPLYVAHGTDDKPLENSRVLVRRYQQLGLNVTQSWPETGHAVWLRTYAGAGFWPWLTRWQRPKESLRLTVQSDALRYGKRAWLTLRQFTERGPRGRVSARLDGESLTATTNNIEAFAIERSGASAQLSRAVIDGEAVSLPPTQPIGLSRASGHWQALPATEHDPNLAVAPKHAGVEGPIHDAFLGRVTFVFGSGDPSRARANRELARTFATPRYGANVSYRVIADVALTPEDVQTSNLFLVGTPLDNSVLKRLDSALPIHATPLGVRFGNETYSGRNVGTLFIYPNPEAAERYVVVLSAPTPAGVWQALALPELLPDFVVFDDGVAAAAGRKILGAARLQAAGFFTNSWQFPASVEH